MNSLSELRKELQKFPLIKQIAFGAICASRLLEELRQSRIEELDAVAFMEEALAWVWVHLATSKLEIDESYENLMDQLNELRPVDEDDRRYDQFTFMVARAVIAVFSIMNEPDQSVKFASWAGADTVSAYSLRYAEHKRIAKEEWVWQGKALDVLKGLEPGPITRAVFASIPEYDRGPLRANS